MERKRPLDPRPGQFVRATRNSRGLSLRQLAGQTGLAPSTLEAYEQGASCIPIEQLARIAQALEVAVTALLPGAQPANGLAETLWQMSVDLARETDPANVIDALHYTVKAAAGVDVLDAWRLAKRKDNLGRLLPGSELLFSFPLCIQRAIRSNGSRSPANMAHPS